MIPRIKEVEIIEKYKLKITFDDNVTVFYDVEDDIKTIPQFEPLKTVPGLFKSFQLDESRTCLSWSDQIDLPSDIIREYGESI